MLSIHAIIENLLREFDFLSFRLPTAGILIARFSIGGPLTIRNIIEFYFISVVILLLELCLNRIPLRLFHSIFTMIVGLLYIMGSYLGFIIDPKRNAAHPKFIDWTTSKGKGFDSV